MTILFCGNKFLSYLESSVLLFQNIIKHGAMEPENMKKMKDYYLGLFEKAQGRFRKTALIAAALVYLQHPLHAHQTDPPLFTMFNDHLLNQI
jgi:hypothetical protein